jgi:molybdenum cofactor guanylyltransferase
MEPRTFDAAGFVLAGGKSSRMGADKALVHLAGRYLIDRALGILREVCASTSVVGNRADLGSHATVIADIQTDSGPLSGICSALGACPSRSAVFLPVDMPLVPPKLVAFLLARSAEKGSAITAVETDGFAQTFPAVIDCAALPGLLVALKQGNSGCFTAFEFAAGAFGQTVHRLPLESILDSGLVDHPDGVPADQWFLNVNSPQELLLAEQLLQPLP